MANATLHLTPRRSRMRNQLTFQRGLASVAVMACQHCGIDIHAVEGTGDAEQGSQVRSVGHSKLLTVLTAV